MHVVFTPLVGDEGCALLLSRFGENFEFMFGLRGFPQCGFGLGATPTAMANMEALARRYGYSVRAFLIAPIIGAFLIDVCNALVISAFAQVVGR